MKRSILILSAVLLLAPAAAEAAEDVMIVRLGDLNLSSDAGANSALRRIRDAAKAFCGGHGERSLAVHREATQCRARMVGKAVAALDAPLVTARHTGRPGLEIAGR